MEILRHLGVEVAFFLQVVVVVLYLVGPSTRGLEMMSLLLWNGTICENGGDDGDDVVLDDTTNEGGEVVGGLLDHWSECMPIYMQ